MEKKLISILVILLMLSMNVLSLIQPIYASEILNVSVETDKDSYNIGETVTAIVKWNKDMQAADFELNFDYTKLGFNSVELDEDYYNLYQNGKILVSWAEDEVNLQQITFKFTALTNGETEISITPRGFDVGNFETEYTYQVVNKTITITNPNQEPETSVTTLEQYLIANGVDSNGDKTLSDAEWATVKNLKIDGYFEEIDLTGIEKAVNLKSLELHGINPDGIDFSKLTKLEKLIIDMNGISEDTKIDIVFPELTKLKTLDIRDVDSYNGETSINSLDISRLKNLEELHLVNTFLCDIKYPSSLVNLKYASFFVKNDFEFDFSNCPKLEMVFFWFKDNLISNGVETLPSGIKYSDNLFAEIHADGPSTLILYNNIEKNVSILKGGTTYIYGNGIELKEDSILENNGCEIIAKEVGTEDIVIKDRYNKSYTVTVNVYEENNDTTLENTDVTAEFIDNGSKILKSNGELWEVTSETTAEKIDTNVKAYVSDLVYTNDMYNGFYIENTLKKDNTLIVEYNGVEKEISNVTSMTEALYVNTAGELYELNINYITEEMKPTKILEDVRYVQNKYGTKYIIMNDWSRYKVLDGWRNYTANNEYEETTPANRVPMTGNVNEHWIGVNVKLKCDCLGACCEDYHIACLFEKEYDDNGYRIGYIHGEEILNHVKYINYYGQSDVLIREDGSIWTYSEQYGLTKITKSTPTPENPPIVEKEEYIKNPIIKEKEIGGDTVISGIGANKKVEDLLKDNNFNNKYTLKVYDSNNNLVASTELLGTGVTVKLYNENNEVVQEYVIVIYGDTTGDGVINAVDALTLIKGINNKVPFKSEIHKEAGNIVAASGKIPSAVDALAIVKAANNKYTINQSK